MKVLLLSLVLASVLPSFAIAQTAHSGGGALAYERSFASDPIIKPHNTLRSREYQPNSITNNTFQYATPSTVTMSHRPVVRSLSSYNYAKRYEKPQNAPFTKTKPQNITQTILINREVLASDCPKGTEEQSDGRCLKIRKIVETRKPVILISPCPKGTSAKEDGSCVKRQKVIVKKTPVIVKAECPKGTKDIGDGRCAEPAKKVIRKSPIIIPANCPKGTKEQKDGTCLEHAKKVVKPKPVIIETTCPKGTKDNGDGTCLEPAKKIVKQKPKVINEKCPKGTKDQGNGLCLKPRKIIEQAPKIVTLPCPKGTTRHYSGDSCISKPQLMGENISKPKHLSQKDVLDSQPIKKKPTQPKTTKICDPNLGGIMSDEALAGGLGSQDTSCISLQ